jgi:acetyl-CoA acyltransferase 2
MMQNIFIVAAKRTPFGSFGGSLKHLSATDLATIATKSALEAGNVDPSVVDSVFVGNVIQSSADAAYLARHVGLVCIITQIKYVLAKLLSSHSKSQHSFFY